MPKGCAYYVILYENGTEYQRPDGSVELWLDRKQAEDTLAHYTREAQKFALDTAYRTSQPFPTPPREMGCRVVQVRLEPVFPKRQVVLDLLRFGQCRPGCASIQHDWDRMNARQPCDCGWAEAKAAVGR